MSNEEMITITKKEYDSLKEDERWRICVESAGVDNWPGMEYAMQEFFGNEED